MQLLNNIRALIRKMKNGGLFSENNSLGAGGKGGYFGGDGGIFMKLLKKSSQGDRGRHGGLKIFSSGGTPLSTVPMYDCTVCSFIPFC